MPQTVATFYFYSVRICIEKTKHVTYLRPLGLESPGRIQNLRSGAGARPVELPQTWYPASQV